MSDEIKINRAQPAVSRPQAGASEEPASSGGPSKGPWIILGLVIVLIIVLGVLFREKLFGGKSGGEEAVIEQVSDYQAVFLTNGQVYFGKVANSESTYVTLNDIFYLQVVQPPLQGTAQESEAAIAAQEQQPQISLVKLGNELHGPVDEMHINRDHILFFEDLKADGQVVTAIKDYKANPPQ